MRWGWGKADEDGVEMGEFFLVVMGLMSTTVSLFSAYTFRFTHLTHLYDYITGHRPCYALYMYYITDVALSSNA